MSEAKPRPSRGRGVRGRAEERTPQPEPRIEPQPEELPPDSISIPESLKGLPVSREGLSVRLRHHLDYANIRCLGDLDGKRLSELAGYRGCGLRTIWQLRNLIVAALQPGAETDRTTLPTLLR